MSSYQHNFFESKKPWSAIKDTVLANYVEPYLKKVRNLKRPILFVDAFAGRGVFEDREKGSPLIICEAAERWVPGRYEAIFANKERDDHLVLEQTIRPYIEKKTAQALHTDAATLLQMLNQKVEDHVLFLYIDPFGLSGFDFELLRPLLERVRRGHSTELLVNMMMPDLHRKAAREASTKAHMKKQTLTKQEALDKVFGGQYWRPIMLDPDLETDERERRVIEKYMNQLRGYMRFVVSCPVRARHETRVKYYITFCSRHPDAMGLMNDTMLAAYEKYMFSKEAEDVPLFHQDDDHESWKLARRHLAHELYKIIPEYIQRFDPRRSRRDLWDAIVEDHFMDYRKAEYHAAVERLVRDKKVVSVKPDGTLGLNDEAILYLSHEAPI